MLPLTNYVSCKVTMLFFDTSHYFPHISTRTRTNGREALKAPDRAMVFIIVKGRIPVFQVNLYTVMRRNDVSVDRPHIRQWSRNIIKLTTVLQLPTVFSTVTRCTGL